MTETGENKSSSTSAIRRTSWIRRLLFTGLILGLVCIVAVLAIIVLVDLEGVIKQYKEPLLSQVSSQLQRKVEVEDIKASKWPSLSIGLDKFAIQAPARAGEDAPALLTFEKLRFGVSLSAALFSLGRRVEINEVTVVKPTLYVERMTDGRFRFYDLTEPSKSPEETTEESTEEPKPETKEEEPRTRSQRSIGILR